MNTVSKFIILLAATISLVACARQSTPSMMNTAKPQLLAETTLQQVPVKSVSTGYLRGLASDYARYGADVMQISLAHDPNSKTYGAMQAFKDLSDIKEKLKKLGVRSIVADTVKAEGSAPTLMISYDGLKAAAPNGCRNMPGFDDGLTTAQIGDYKFGCSVDSMLARQIYRPSDLQGYAGADDIDGRRAANTVEYYQQVSPEEAEGDIQRFERGDIQQ